MQAKEVDTLICLEEYRLVPLKLHYKHLVISAEVDQLNLKYRGLWKFFIFMHPDDLKNDIAVSQVITRFCRVANMSAEEVKKVSPYGFYTDEELRHRYLREWWKNKRSWVPATAFDDVEEVIEDPRKWSECMGQEVIMKTSDCYFQQFDRIFLRTQSDKYLDTIRAKKLEKHKAKFRKFLASEFEKNPAKWMTNIESSPSRGSNQPIVSGSEVFRSAFEKFIGPKISLDRYTKVEK